MSSDEHLRYPKGKFVPSESYSSADISQNIKRIEATPLQIEKMVSSLTTKQLDTTYRDGGWTARQVIHHVADSHMNAYIRFKWTLTENTPLIKAYDEKLWADTAEVNGDPVLSVNLLKALHVKWVTLLSKLTPADFQREFIHPETQKKVRLDRALATYAWHGEHHLGHLEIISKK
jgi:hypothetical protein